MVIFGWRQLTPHDEFQCSQRHVEITIAASGLFLVSVCESTSRYSASSHAIQNETI